VRKPLVRLLATRLSGQTTPARSQVFVKRPDMSMAASDNLTSAMMAPARMSRKPMLMLLGLTVGLTLSAWGHAVGLGGINVVSALGQPLKAEIELVALSKSDKPGLVARLASPDAYKGAGLDYPFGVKYSFEVGNRANGESYLKLSSNREINDPFVSLLVELSWSSGRLMREYTFLLDPPGYVAAQPKAAIVEDVVPAMVQSAPLTSRETAVGEVPTRQVETSVAQPDEKPLKKHFSSAMYEKTTTQSGGISVKTGDFLTKIAAEVKPDNVSLERMLVALYRANADQFDGRNMNRIQSGKILRMPDQDAVKQISQAEAVHEIHAQASDWNAYRRKLAAVATTGSRSEATRQVATGKISSPAVDKTPIATESAKEVLRLSRGEAPSGKAGSAGRAAQDKANAAAEEAIAKSKAVNEEKTRAALLESNLKDMQRLAELKSEAAALAASAASVKVTTDVMPASAVAPASHVKAVVKPVVKPAVPEASLLDQLLGSPIALGIGAAVLLALGGLGIVFNRRRQAKKVDHTVEGTKTGHLTSPVAPSPDTGDFTAKVMPVEEVAPQSEDIDPISEAELFLNFGRDEQAEEVLKDALRHSPDNHQIHLKLLSIYATRQDAQSFAKIQQLLQGTGDEEAIGLAEVLARKLEPAHVEDDAVVEDNVFAEHVTADDFAEAVGLADAAADAEDDQTHAIDFDVTSSFPAQTADVDFDVTSTSPSLAAALDFDIASSQPDSPANQEDEALPNLDDLIFDVMSPESETRADEAFAPVVEKPLEEDDGMEFTLDFPMDNVEEKPAPLPPSVNLADISLDMDDIGAPTAEVAEVEKSEQWHEVATKLDLARAYQEMGDEVGAREILDEVVLEGDEAQKQEAQLLIKQLG
jgi:pilus assembly protein FimV